VFTETKKYIIVCQFCNTTGCPIQKKKYQIFMCRSQWERGLGVGVRPLACWNCGFESRRQHGCLSLVSTVCCQVEGSARADQSAQVSYRLWCVVVCYLITSIMRRPWAALGRSATGNIYIYIYIYTYTHIQALLATQLKFSTYEVCK